MPQSAAIMVMEVIDITVDSPGSSTASALTKLSRVGVELK
jgi:hypothetical protein